MIALATASRSYYAKRGNASARAALALASAARLSAAGTDVGVDLCLHNVRTWLNLPFVGDTAIEAWHNAAARKPDPTHGWYGPPAGVPVFWSGGSSGAGHIALADGRGNVWSTDIERRGRVDLVPVGDIHARWGLKYLGWSEFLGDYRVYL